MNKIKMLSKWMVFTVAFATATGAFAQQQPVNAIVRAIRGTASYNANGKWLPLKVNAKLPAGSFVKTEAESTIDLFVNNSVIRVTPDTTLGLDSLQATDTGAEKITETQLSLKTGRILGNVKKLAAASSYQIKTPNGVTGVRGTDFDISYIKLPSGKFELTVRSVVGTLVTSAANSQGVILTAVVNTGEQWTPDEGASTLPAPLLEDLRVQIQRVIDSIPRPDNATGGPPSVPTPQINKPVSPR